MLHSGLIYFLGLIVSRSLAIDGQITGPVVLNPPPTNFGILGTLNIPMYPEIMNSENYNSINLTIKTVDDLMQGLRSDKVKVDFFCSDPYIVLDKPSLTIMRGGSSFLVIRRNQDFRSPWSTLVEKAATITVKVSFIRGANTLIRTINTGMPVNWKFSGAQNGCYIEANIVKDKYGAQYQQNKSGFYVLARTSTMAIYGSFNYTTGILESILYNYMGVVTEAYMYNGKKWFRQHLTVHPDPDPTVLHQTYNESSGMVSFGFPDGTSFTFSNLNFKFPIVHFHLPEYHQLDGLCNMASASMEITKTKYDDIWLIQFPIVNF